MLDGRDEYGFERSKGSGYICATVNGRLSFQSDFLAIKFGDYLDFNQVVDYTRSG